MIGDDDLHVVPDFLKVRVKQIETSQKNRGI